MKPQKTNAMRILEQHEVAYEPVFYDLKGQEFSGEAVAALTGIPPEQSFKTLTAKGSKNGIFVFVVPVGSVLDLKKAAAAAKEKKVELLAVKELVAATGYMRGEVSPLGMKKQYPVLIDDTALSYAWIVVSAGKKGASVKLEPQALARVAAARFVSLRQNECE